MAIFLCIGTVILIAGFAVNPVLNGLAQTGGGQLAATVFWMSFEPFLIGSIIMFIIGGVAFYVGERAITVNVEKPPQTFKINEPNTAVSGKSKILCGSCQGVNDIDAVYCKKCGKQLR